jgi:hypothetical protein
MPAATLEMIMGLLDQLVADIRSAAIEVIDLTARLESTTPVIQLPPPFANTVSFSLHEVSRYDERGPAWYWNDISTGEHTGTHFDAPCTGSAAATARTSPRYR